MDRVRNAIALIALAGLLAAAPAAAGNYALATKWRLTGEAQIDCLGHADEAIRRAGFDLTEPGSQSFMGRRGDYTAAVRCVTEQRMVFFAVSGPSPSEVNRLLDAIYNVY